MTDHLFRAKLRLPKNELWLGCIIDSKRSWINKNGQAGLTIGFSNCPYFGNFTKRDFHMQGRLPMIGDVVSLDVRWLRLDSGQVFPRGRILL